MWCLEYTVSYVCGSDAESTDIAALKPGYEPLIRRSKSRRGADCGRGRADGCGDREEKGDGSMGKIKVTPCHIEGLYVIEPEVHEDARGYFVETYNQRDFEAAGLDMLI